MDGIIHRAAGDIFNTAGYVSGANVFGATPITPKKGVSRFAIQFASNAAAILSMTATDGTTTATVTLNAGNALVANALYRFDVMVRSGLAYNLQYASNATLLLVSVDEIVQES
jgi:hypothetical protein